jgi:hypothetical protein
MSEQNISMRRQIYTDVKKMLDEKEIEDAIKKIEGC